MTDNPHPPSVLSAALSWRRIMRMLWGVLGIPVAMAIFAIMLVLMFPVGGGIAHLMFAYSPGGNVASARYVFVGFLLATLFLTGFLRWTRYPAAWYVRASLTSAIALWMWLPWPLATDAGMAFRVQGLLLAPLLPAAAFAVASWSARRQRSRAPSSNDALQATSG